MKSKNWMMLLLAPITVGALTACQNNNDHNDESSPSTFTGVWMNQQAVTTFRQNITNLNNDDREAFCRAVAEDCVTYGLRQDGPMRNVVLDALLIQSNGEVSRYTPEIRAQAANRAYVEALHIGHISNDGDFRRIQRNTINYATGYGWAGLPPEGDPRFRLADTTFFKEDNNRISVDGYAVNRTGATTFTGQAYLRVEEKEVRAYVHVLHGCMQDINDGRVERRRVNESRLAPAPPIVQRAPPIPGRFVPPPRGDDQDPHDLVPSEDPPPRRR